MKADRELNELVKAIADQLKMPPVSILKKAAKLGLTVKRKGQKRPDARRLPDDTRRA
jgi:hypothetical protein